MEVEIPLVDSFTLGGMIDDDPNPPFFMSVRGIYVDGEERFGESLEDARIRRNQSLEAADASIDQLSRIRATIGAYINRLEHTATYVSAANIAAQTSLSRIFDTDMAAEMSNYSRLQVLTQTATSIMAQANQTPQNVLQLLS
jgi:flagellin-like hook-associated protein FlgL